MQDALEFCIKSVSTKRQTVKEIEDKLAKRFPEANAQEIISRLRELDYLDDKAFSSAWVRHRSVSSPRGKWVLKSELKRKGITEQDMEEALQAFDEEPVLQELAKGKWEKLRGEKDLRKRKEKLMRFLTSRGFAFSDVLEMTNSFASDSENC